MNLIFAISRFILGILFVIVIILGACVIIFVVAAVIAFFMVIVWTFGMWIL